MTGDLLGGAGGLAGDGGAGPGAFGPPPGPPAPPPAPPPGPPAPPPVDPLRAVAVALLNLSGLGLGYALIRRWFAMAACWTATGVLLAAALPADPDGVPGGLLIACLVFLGLAALHGAVRGLRTPLAWPPRSPVAIALGLVLLAGPAGGAMLYDGARDEAVEQMLLDRLDQADRLVQAARGKPFGTAEPDYREALAAYRDLSDGHPDSRAAGKVPNRLSTYYKAVAGPFGAGRYCEAIAPLKYLRTLPGPMGGKRPGSLRTWPDDRLATSLYECGMDDLASGASAAGGGRLGELLTTFPGSSQAAKVEPAVSDAIDRAAKAARGKEPCPAVDRLHTLSAQAAALPGEKAGVAAALKKDAGKAGKGVQSGTYACGVDQYQDGDFDAARKTMSGFIGTYKKDRNRPRAQKIVIAAEIAAELPAAGKRLPTTASGGGISITVSNDSPGPVEVLYTGPVTGRFTLNACSGCTTYSSTATGRSSACNDSGRNYPRRTISLPAGTTYFLHKHRGSTTTIPATDTVKLRPGYIYTECAYAVEGFGLGY